MRRSAWLVLIVVLVGAGLVAVGWAVLPRAWSANEVAKSDEVVREFAKTVSREVRAYRRGLRPIAAEAEREAGAVAGALATIDARAKEAVKKVRQHTRSARDEIDDMDYLLLRTQGNRINRILARAREAEQFITQTATQAKIDVQADY